MGLPQSSNSPHLYPQALQLKLYQAFIFSIPILFSIILFLLFYLFYLKRRAYNLSSSTSILPTRSDHHQPTPYVSSPCQVGLKGELKDQLPIVLFDEELRKRDSQGIFESFTDVPFTTRVYSWPKRNLVQLIMSSLHMCCVCLGDFEIKEELLQVPSCKHVFHIDCIHHWLHTNTSCPLCRCSVIPTVKLCHPTPTPSPPPPAVPEPQSSTSPQTVSVVEVPTSTITRGPPMAMEESSSSTSYHSRVSWGVCSTGNEMPGYPDRESVVVHVQTVHNS